jgi:hypothetical protein
MLRKIVFALIFLATASALHAAPPAAAPQWKTKLASEMPLLGHRNWIMVVDSAYPLQTSDGVEVIETNADQLEVVRSVLSTVNASIHVRPVFFMDAELPFITEQESPGVSTYRKQIGSMLSKYGVESKLHDQLIANVADTAKNFHVLVLKTRMTIPYTSVFIRLDCKYWSAEQEQDLRKRMSAAK